VAECFCQPPLRGTQPLALWLSRHLERAERIAAGPGADTSELWKKAAGRKARAAIAALEGADRAAPDDAATSFDPAEHIESQSPDDDEALSRITGEDDNEGYEDKPE
jgi:hypothetical protein